MDNIQTDHLLRDIAIIGMAGRFPNSKYLDEFWKNLLGGVECVSSFSDEDLLSSGIDRSLINNPNYVRRKAFLEDTDLFDASFFGINPGEAEIIDPQQRLFLESSYELLESAGYNPEEYAGLIGVYAGCSANSYLLNNILGNRKVLERLGRFQVSIGSDKDFLTTRTSYKLNLRGPSIDIQTACSTSLVAVHIACQSLLNYECDMAIAGGVSISVPQKSGYLYQEGMVLSPDGRCRPFDAKAQGFVGGEGVGVVLLKRLSDALADRDCIRAVIKGSAINNDGSWKVGYTAPSIDGQAEVIAMAQASAGIEADTISYVESHGTGTPLGDPIELAALTKAFRSSTDKTGFCAIGSVKSNIGHLDAAAGIASLIKTVLALEHKMLPPSLHFEEPNPEIDFKYSPFYVNTLPSEWKTGESLRRAGVSSFGIGGTNAHVIIEEAPAIQASECSRKWQLLTLSSKSDSALSTMSERLVEHFTKDVDPNLSDAAYTLQAGRRRFSNRRIVVCRSIDDAVLSLNTLDPRRVCTTENDAESRRVAFMFSGQGSQHVNMALNLYEEEPGFREQVDFCSKFLRPHLGCDLSGIMYPDAKDVEDASRRLTDTAFAQPALFVIEYALAKLWEEWGIRPHAMIGHSIGEYVAACLAGVFSLEEALTLVARRGQLIQKLPSGAMMAVVLPETEVLPCLNEELSLAAVNGPALCVTSGAQDAIDALEKRFVTRGVNCIHLHTSHAFHSKVVESVLPEFIECVRKINLKPPKMKYLSNVTGTWITDAEATDPMYWARHLRQTVRFAAGVAELLKDPGMLLLEVGPGRALSTIVEQYTNRGANQTVLSSLRHSKEKESDSAVLLKALGRLWLEGANVDWKGFHKRDRLQRVPLPTYPFERRRYWIDAKSPPSEDKALEAPFRKQREVSDWFYRPSWKRSIFPKPSNADAFKKPKQCWLVLLDQHDLGHRLVKQLRFDGYDVVTAAAGERFGKVAENTYTICPDCKDDYDDLLTDLKALGKTPVRIVHLWKAAPQGHPLPEIELIDEFETLGFHSMIFLAQSLAKFYADAAIEIDVVTNNLHEVTGEEVLSPEAATILGPCKVIPQEHHNIKCRSIDFSCAAEDDLQQQALIDQLLGELIGESSDTVVAYRGRHRWVENFEAIRLPPPISEGIPRLLRESGVYLITGGLGTIGSVLSKYLAKSVSAKLILTSRSGLPLRKEWEEWLALHGDGDNVSRKIRMVQRLEQLGAEVLVFSADVANLEQMQEVISRSNERFGPINGVVHAAGILGYDMFRSVEKANKIDSAQQFRPKVFGLTVLKEIFEDQVLDFCLLMSSLSSVLGGLGFASYSAANLFMDAFAHKYGRKGSQPWISVNWDGWNLGGEIDNDSSYKFDSKRLAITTPEEGIEAFKRLFSMEAEPQVIVSTGNLQPRIDRRIARKFLPDTESSRKKDPSTWKDEVNLSKSKHPRPKLSTGYIAPTSDAERAVAAVWEDLLRVEGVGAHDDFFELGGDSLLLVQVLNRIQKFSDNNISIRALFQHPTIASSADYLACYKPDRASLSDQEALSLQRVPRDQPLDVSVPQERLWFLAQLEPDNTAYNISGGVRLRGNLRVDILKKSLMEIIRRHETLRTTFGKVNGKPVQVISPELPFDLQLFDLKELSETEQKTRSEQLTAEVARRPFDLAKGPLLRAVLVQLGVEENLLIIVMHHIITDGWSVGIFMHELGTFYSAFLEGQPPPWPDLKIQYADFAHCQRKWLRAGVLESQLSYWKEKLSGEIPVLQLPSDRLRPAVQSYQGTIELFEFPNRLKKDLNRLSQDRRATLYMTLLAAFNALIHRYTGQTDFAVGSPIANRNLADIEPLIGFFVNTLVLRTDLSEDPSFVDLLERVKETALNAFANQDTPFEKLVESLNPSRDMSYSPLFQVMFVLQVPTTSSKLPGLTLTPFVTETGSSMFDLTLYMSEDEKGLSGRVEYSTDLFNAETIERFIGHFGTLLESVVADPSRRLSELSLLTDAERHQILTVWNNTYADYPRDKCFGRLFEEQAARTPEAPAVVCAGTTLTYRDLNSRANRVANHLLGLGTKPDDIIGIYTDRSIDMVVGLLGILKAGSTYTPLDPGFPADRIEFMLQDSNARILITQDHLRENIKNFSGRMICIDSGWETISREKDTNPSPFAEPYNLAYVLYTSGSTGKPKGVQISHKALVNFLYSMQKEPGLTNEDTLLSVTTMSFDIFGLELFLPLLFGARTVIAERDDTLDGLRLAAMIEEHGVSIMQATPLTWRILIESGWSGSKSLKAICGGEAFPSDLAGPMLSRCRELWNLYGPTETTIWSTAFRVRSEQEPVLIGYPIDNTQVYILDDSLQPLPIGVVGELHIGGDGLSRGYLNRPELTEEKFIPHPFSDKPGARIYKTGDLARYRPDGSIECLGRIDHQVKLRGFRIELGEIEARIKDNEAVANCVVALREDWPGDKHLVAYYVARDGGGVPVPELRSYLHSKLPEYMVPQHFVKLESIPLTPNGKIDKKALPKPVVEGLSHKEFVAPRTEIEQAIASVWQQVLKVDRVGINSNFFELGGHSLLATQIMSRLYQLFNVQLPLRKLFEASTVKDLAELLEISLDSAESVRPDVGEESEEREIFEI